MTEEQSTVAAGRAVVETAASRGLQVRLLGGVAIWLRAHEEARKFLGRPYADLDLIAHRKESRKLRDLLSASGFLPDDTFNALHGASRLLFYAADRSHQIDIFLDHFEMSHKFDFTRRMELEPLTMTAADLLLTKLQVGQLTEKDAVDTVMLVWSHEVGNRDAAAVLNLPVVADACAAEWGLFTTASDNLESLLRLLPRQNMPEEARELVRERVTKIREAMELKPKGARWKMRARVGRRLPWHEMPEEVRR
ncbi:MAG TPA: hypothetical protein VET26_00940 [Candidatus Sulfotelmatobacter sp.]|nr:hypothetical protein [Candidatus Sulfotelmatobacter sp.]